MDLSSPINVLALVLVACFVFKRLIMVGRNIAAKYNALCCDFERMHVMLNTHSEMGVATHMPCAHLATPWYNTEFAHRHGGAPTPIGQWMETATFAGRMPKLARGGKAGRSRIGPNAIRPVRRAFGRVDPAIVKVGPVVKPRAPIDDNVVRAWLNTDANVNTDTAFGVGRSDADAFICPTGRRIDRHRVRHNPMRKVGIDLTKFDTPTGSTLHEIQVDELHREIEEERQSKQNIGRGMHHVGTDQVSF